MPYSCTEDREPWPTEAENRAGQALLAMENDRSLREYLAKEHAVPAEFMDIAVNVWHDGKED